MSGSMPTEVMIKGASTPIDQRIAIEMERAARRFLEADLGDLQKACNQKRREFLAQSDEAMKAAPARAGLPKLEVRKAREEATPEFRFTAPRKLTIEICPFRWP